MFNLKGSIVALVTPMDSDGAIHWEGLKDLIEWHINKLIKSYISKILYYV